MRAHLTSCGIEHDLQLVPGRALSGGQRSRCAGPHNMDSVLTTWP